MKQKQTLIARASLPEESGPVNSYEDSYRFGASLTILGGTPVATAVIEQTVNGGTTWTNVMTFTLDSNGFVEIPVGSALVIDGLAIRARLTSITGGAAEVSVWMGN